MSLRLGYPVWPASPAIGPQYMAKTGEFSHTQANGTDVFDMIVNAGIDWYGAGEIIAWNTAAALDCSAAFAVQGWMGSPSHRRS